MLYKLDIILLTIAFLIMLLVTVYIYICLRWGRKLGYNRTKRYLLAYTPTLILVALIAYLIQFILTYYYYNKIPEEVIVPYISFDEWARYAFPGLKYTGFFIVKNFFFVNTCLNLYAKLLSGELDFLNNMQLTSMTVGILTVIFAFEMFFNFVTHYYGHDKLATALTDDLVLEMLEELVREVLAEERLLRFDNIAYKMNFVN